MFHHRHTEMRSLYDFFSNSASLLNNYLTEDWNNYREELWLSRVNCQTKVWSEYGRKLDYFLISLNFEYICSSPCGKFINYMYWMQLRCACDSWKMKNRKHDSWKVKERYNITIQTRVEYQLTWISQWVEHLLQYDIFK